VLLFAIVLLLRVISLLRARRKKKRDQTPQHMTTEGTAPSQGPVLAFAGWLGGTTENQKKVHGEVEMEERKSEADWSNRVRWVRDVKGRG
jgi:hypothetical protein